MVVKTPCDIKNELVEAITEVSWVVESGDAHDLQDACDLAHESMDDAFNLIEQLEADNAQLNRCIENMTDKLNAANDEIAQLQAERDAALADFKLYRERNIKGECGVYACDLCKHGGRYEELDEIKCPTGCMGVSHWEWRGVQKEE